MDKMEQAKKYIIYKVTNNINGKIYIGQTMYSLKHRVSGHKTAAFSRKKDTKFYNALRKYGFENFVFEQIDVALGWEDASKKEKYYISMYDSYKNGYNSDLGGNTRPISEDERKRISEKLKGHVVSEETKLKLKDRWKNRTSHKWTDEQKKAASIRMKKYFLTHDGTNKGKKFSIEHCQHISEALKGRKLSEEQKKHLSEIQKGKKISKETRKKISESSMGKKLSEETKKKISETRKAKGLGNYGRWKKS